MSTAFVNSVRLFYELTGDAGPPLVLVHGSWGDHTDWDPIVPALAQRFRVLTYDRRGHSQSERPHGQGSVAEDADDLAALVEQLGLAPAYVAGNSFGGTIALRLAARRPDLVRGLTVHEPPLFDLLATDPEHAPTMHDALSRLDAVAARLATGDAKGGTRQFMETVALGPGAWDALSFEVRQRFVANAPTFWMKYVNQRRSRSIRMHWPAFPIRCCSPTATRVHRSFVLSLSSLPLTCRALRRASSRTPDTIHTWMIQINSLLPSRHSPLP